MTVQFLLCLYIEISYWALVAKKRKCSFKFLERKMLGFNNPWPLHAMCGYKKEMSNFFYKSATNSKKQELAENIFVQSFTLR